MVGIEVDRNERIRMNCSMFTESEFAGMNGTALIESEFNFNQVHVESSSIRHTKSTMMGLSVDVDPLIRSQTF